ncbi:MAG TPA: DUF484 family protein [Alphaproteobacteria bacterium]|jgi:hypothetical protein
MTDAKPKREAIADRPPPEKIPSQADIRAFLAANPRYLTENPEVLDALVPDHRHNGEQVIDMQGFLIDRLRAENGRLTECHAKLLATTRTNLASQGRIHGAALALLEARSFRELIEVATTDLAVRLDVDVAVLAVENSGGLPDRTVSGIRLLQRGGVDRLMGTERDVVLNAHTRGRKLLYGAATGLVASEALLRLHASPEAPTGLLALASREGGRFDSGQGTELLGFLARTLELCIRTWLGLPRS